MNIAEVMLKPSEIIPFRTFFDLIPVNGDRSACRGKEVETSMKGTAPPLPKTPN